MEHLSASITPFLKCLENNHVIRFNPDGSWKKCPAWFPKKLHSQLENFTAFLDKCENLPLLIDKFSEVHPKVLSIQGQYLDAAIAFESYVLRGGCRKTHPLFHRFKIRLLGLMYRLGELAPSRQDQHLLQDFTIQAQQWKVTEKAFWTTKLDFDEEHILQTACQYSYYISEVLKNPTSLRDLFKWLIRDGMPIKPLIEYPSLIETLYSSHLIGRVSRLGGTGLKIKEFPITIGGDVIEKFVTLPFEGKDTNILDPHKKVTFFGDYTLTIQEVFNIFEHKKIEAGNLEYMAEGIINWHTQKLAYWNAFEKHYVTIDLLADEWWNQLPEFETMSLKEARAKYGTHLDGTNWNFSIRASREDHSLNFIHTHSYLEVAIPWENHRYKIFDFGKFSTKFPKNAWEEMWQFSVVTAAAIAYPDENVYYTHRQHVNFSHAASKAEGFEIMESIKRDMLKARQGNFVFQIESENCGKWIHGILSHHLGDDRVPNYFKLPLLDTQPKGPVKWIFRFLRKLPSNFPIKLLTFMHFPLGAWKGVWLKSEDGKKFRLALVNTEFWNDTVIYLPAMLHHKYEAEHSYQSLNVRIPTSGYSRKKRHQ